MLFREEQVCVGEEPVGDPAVGDPASARGLD